MFLRIGVCIGFKLDQTIQKITIAGNRFYWNLIFGRLLGRIFGGIFRRVFGRIFGRLLGRLLGRLFGRLLGRLLGRISGGIFRRVFGRISGEGLGLYQRIILRIYGIIRFGRKYRCRNHAHQHGQG